MSNNLPAGAEVVAKTAAVVGGDLGKVMTAALEASLGDPNLKQLTRFGSAVDAIASIMGDYTPGCLPISTMKQMRTDGQLRFALAAVKAPLVAAPMHFECNSRDVQQLLTDVFIKSGFVQELLRTSLNAIDFGFQAHEMLWKTEDLDLEYEQQTAEGGLDVKEKSYPGLFVPRRFKDLDPALTRLLKDDKGDLVGLTFGASSIGLSPGDLLKQIGQGKINVLPIDKAFIFTPVFEFQNYRGESRLNWAYDPWYWQRIMYMIALRWYERKADPPLIGHAPTTSSLDGQNIDLDDTDDAGYSPTAENASMVLMAKAMQRLRSTGGCVLPSEVYMDDENRPSNTRIWEIKELDVKDMHPAFIDMIDHLDKKKTRSIFAPDIALSRDRQAGTLGSTEAIVDTTIEMQNDTLKSFINQFNQHVLNPFLAYNGIKDRARLVTTGVLQDNRLALKEVMLKVLEADMLAEQAWGRAATPGSLTSRIDRSVLMSQVGVPAIPTEPGAVPPAPPPEMLDPAAGRDRLSNGPDPKARRGSGGGTAKPGKAAGYALDTLSPGYLKDASFYAEQAEEWATYAGSRTTARDSLSLHEKAVTALALWYLLRADKTDQGGATVAATPAAAALGHLLFDEAGEVRPPAALAAALPALTAEARNLEGRGLRLAGDTEESRAARAKAEASITKTLAGMPDAVSQTDIRGVLVRSTRLGEEAARSLLAKYGVADVPGLSQEDVDRIVDDNLQALLLNVSNISRRSAASLLEAMVMSRGRSLGLVSDSERFAFNRLYSDLSIEAHIRAAYRLAVSKVAQAAKVPHLVKIPGAGETTHSRGSEYDYRVEPDSWWRDRGESLNAPLPHETYGFHHGSTSVWYPVPESVRRR